MAMAAAAVGLATVATAAALIAPQTGFARALAAVLPLAEPHAAAAEAAFRAGEFPIAEAETRAELRVSPVRESAWLRLARIDFARHHAFTPMGVEALSHAFDAVPYDLARYSERAVFMQAHFAELPPALQTAAADEARVRAEASAAPATTAGL
jgi:hypothetical protein